MAVRCKMDKYYIQNKDKSWCHRSPLKKVINPILRKIQFFTNCPFVIASKTIFNDEKPHFVKYKFCRIPYQTERK